MFEHPVSNSAVLQSLTAKDRIKLKTNFKLCFSYVMLLDSLKANSKMT